MAMDPMMMQMLLSQMGGMGGGQGDGGFVGGLNDTMARIAMLRQMRGQQPGMGGNAGQPAMGQGGNAGQPPGAGMGGNAGMTGAMPAVRTTELPAPDPFTSGSRPWATPYLRGGPTASQPFIPEGSARNTAFISPSERSTVDPLAYRSVGGTMPDPVAPAPPGIGMNGPNASMFDDAGAYGGTPMDSFGTIGARTPLTDKGWEMARVAGNMAQDSRPETGSAMKTLAGKIPPQVIGLGSTPGVSAPPPMGLGQRMDMQRNGYGRRTGADWLAAALGWA